MIDAVIAEQHLIIARAAPYEENSDMVRSTLIEGAEKAKMMLVKRSTRYVKSWG